ncbi:MULTISPECIES: ATP-binding protein [Streptomyces]|uniref:ATP-binding protein n=1 Tax=Streptomyces sanyensis TaxID=568869 RepID=A0ABP9B1M1_9ACTN
MTIHRQNRRPCGTPATGAPPHAPAPAPPPQRPSPLCSHRPGCGAGGRELPGGFAACGLSGHPRNAGQARRFVADTLDAWSLTALGADMELVVTELVSNAVRHGLGTDAAATDFPVWLGLFRHPGHLVCAVADPSPAPPRPREAGECATGGRGLALIGALSEAWSWCPTAPHGKTVWASLPLPRTGA